LTRRTGETSPPSTPSWVGAEMNGLAPCKVCEKPVAYRGALFCGAACCARYEAGDTKENRVATITKARARAAALAALEADDG